MAMKQLTPELREALMTDMRSFFDNDLSDEGPVNDVAADNENGNHGGDIPK